MDSCPIASSSYIAAWPAASVAVWRRLALGLDGIQPFEVAQLKILSSCGWSSDHLTPAQHSFGFSASKAHATRAEQICPACLHSLIEAPHLAWVQSVSISSIVLETQF